MSVSAVNEEWILAEEQVGEWWRELLGQPASVSGFDKDLAELSIPRSDLVAARVIADKFKNRLTFVDRLEEWHAWDGRVHRPLESAALVKTLLGVFADALTDALAFVESVYESEALAILAAGGASAQKDAQKKRDEYKKFTFGGHRSYRDRIYSTAGMSSLLAALQVEATVPSNWYANDTRWLVVENGVIDIDAIRETKAWPELLEHSPDRPVTRWYQGCFDINATGDEWYKFLSRSVPDVETRWFLTKVTAVAFMAEPKVKVIPNLQGPKDSGKSLFIDVITALGGGYAVAADPSALMQQQGTNWEQDEFRHKRIIGTSEPDERARLDEGFVKRFSGGDIVRTRTLHTKSSAWRPQGVMFVASNHVVKFNTRDGALLDRVTLINFPNQFLDSPEAPEEIRMDKQLFEKLMSESSLILNWIIWGFLKYLDEGLEPTEQILVNRKETQFEGSTALQWLLEMYDDGWIDILDQSEASVVAKSHFIQVNEAYSSYQVWAAQAGERNTLSRKFFSRDIQSRYGECVTSAGKRFPRLVWTEAWMKKHAPLAGLDGHQF